MSRLNLFLSVAMLATSTSLSSPASARSRSSLNLFFASKVPIAVMTISISASLARLSHGDLLQSISGFAQGRAVPSGIIALKIDPGDYIFPLDVCTALTIM